MTKGPELRTQPLPGRPERGWAPAAGEREQDTAAQSATRRGAWGEAGGGGLARLRQGPPLSAAGMVLAGLRQRKAWRQRGSDGKGHRGDSLSAPWVQGKWAGGVNKSGGAMSTPLTQALTQPRAPQVRSPQKAEHTGVNPPRTGRHVTCYSLRPK